jgi:tyrosinase
MSILANILGQSWLHHVNVDRLTALYQAMHPDSYLTPFPDHYGSYTLPGGGDHNDTLSTPLEPFSTDTEGHFYTSSMVQSLKEFGYSYPEIQDWNQTPQELQAKVITQVNHLYGPSAAKIKRRGSGPQAPTKVWSVRIHVSKFDLGGQRFIVRIFLGDVPQNPLSWSTSETCIGSFPVFPPVQSTEMHPQIPTHNEISLTAGLKARGYDGQDSTTTAKYLERALHWRVQLV